MTGIGVNGYYLMKLVTQSNYNVDLFNLDNYRRFKVGDMVRQPATGHIGILLEEEVSTTGKTGFWLVEWFMGPNGTMLAKRLQTYEYTKSLLLYAIAAKA